MLRVQLNLENQSDLTTAKAQWKFAPGLVPGEANQGLLEGLPSSPARLREYDDSTWDVCDNIQIGRSAGLTFGWFRIKKPGRNTKSAIKICICIRVIIKGCWICTTLK